MIRNLKWNCSNSIKILLSNWFLILHLKSLWLSLIFLILLHLVMQSFFWRRLMIMSAELVAVIVDCLLKFSLCEFDWRWLNRSFAVRLQSQLSQSHWSFSFEIVLNFLQSSFYYQNVDDTVVLTRFLLILSNLNFLSLWSWILCEMLCRHIILLHNYTRISKWEDKYMRICKDICRRFDFSNVSRRDSILTFDVIK